MHKKVLKYACIDRLYEFSDSSSADAFCRQRKNRGVSFSVTFRKMVAGKVILRTQECYSSAAPVFPSHAVFQPLTEEQRQDIYRKMKEEKLLQAAENQWNDYCIRNHIDTKVFQLDQCDFSAFANQFDKSYDCDIAETSQWEEIIHNYLEQYPMNRIVLDDIYRDAEYDTITLYFTAPIALMPPEQRMDADALSLSMEFPASKIEPAECGGMYSLEKDDCAIDWNNCEFPYDFIGRLLDRYNKDIMENI